MFKNIIVLLLLVWSTNAMAESGFYLKIDLLNREVSKDSNSQRYIVEVKNREVGYEFSYSGFPDNSKQSKNRTLSESELAEVIKYIKEQGINRSITEIKPTDANGPSRKVALSLLLKLDGQTTESKISGNYRIFRGDGKIKGAIIKNKKYVDDVKSLIQDLN